MCSSRGRKEMGMAGRKRVCGTVSGRNGGAAGGEAGSRDGMDAGPERRREPTAVLGRDALVPAVAAGAAPVGSSGSVPDALQLQQARIRIASPDDAGAIAGIYRPYVEATAVSFEWSAPEPEEMKARIAKVLAAFPYLVAEHPGTGDMLGYAYASPYYGRQAYCYCCEVSIYLRQGLVRQGLGTRLYDALEGALRLQGLLSLCACIAVADGPDPYLTGASVAFHEARGFRQIGAYPQCGFKFGRWYGVVWMEKPLGSRPKVPEAVLPFPQARGRIEAFLSARQTPAVSDASALRGPSAGR